jgi:hypothetical protein
MYVSASFLNSVCASGLCMASSRGPIQDPVLCSSSLSAAAISSLLTRMPPILVSREGPGAG